MSYVDWIKLEHTTPTKPEIGRIAEILNIDPDMVFGKLVRLWIWADQISEDGNLNVTSCGYINRLLNCDGFAEALLEVKWMAKKSGGFLAIPHFDYHMSKSAKKRANNVKKVRTHRECNQNVTDSLPSCTPDVVTPSSSTSVLDSKEEIKITSDDVFQGLPKELDTDDFKRTWLQLEAYTKKKKGNAFQPYQREPAWRAMLIDYAGYKMPETVISAMLKAMANGWATYYPPKQGQQQNPSEPQQPMREDPKYIEEQLAKIRFCRERHEKKLAEQKAKEASNGNAS